MSDLDDFPKHKDDDVDFSDQTKQKFSDTYLSPIKNEVLENNDKEIILTSTILEYMNKEQDNPMRGLIQCIIDNYQIIETTDRYKYKGIKNPSGIKINVTIDHYLKDLLSDKKYRTIQNKIVNSKGFQRIMKNLGVEIDGLSENQKLSKILVKKNIQSNYGSYEILSWSDVFYKFCVASGYVYQEYYKPYFHEIVDIVNINFSQYPLIEKYYKNELGKLGNPANMFMYLTKTGSFGSSRGGIANGLQLGYETDIEVEEGGGLSKTILGLHEIIHVLNHEIGELKNNEKIFYMEELKADFIELSYEKSKLRTLLLYGIQSNNKKTEHIGMHNFSGSLLLQKMITIADENNLNTSDVRQLMTIKDKTQIDKSIINKFVYDFLSNPSCNATLNEYLEQTLDVAFSKNRKTIVNDRKKSRNKEK